MRVAELSAYHVRIPLRRTVRHASHARTDTDNVLVRCTLADGTVGWGEGVPREYVTGESAGGALALLARSDLAAQLDDCRDYAGAVGLAERLRLDAVPGDKRGIAGNAARCAIELAILDAFGKHFGQPAAAVTMLVAPELSAPQPRVQYSAIIASSVGLKLKLVAWAYRFTGFGQIKVKVGIEGQDDIARLTGVRRWAGSNVRLRVDANEAWPAEDAVERIRELEPFNLEWIEQPIRHGEVTTLAAVRKEIRTPIMLDESVCGMIDAGRAASNGWGDGFNLRLSKCGGLIPTLRLAQYARWHGMTVQLGCQVGETAILSAAGRQLATSVADLLAFEGSFDRHLVRERLSREDITFGRGGWAPALEGPGLGITVDPIAVERVATAREALLG